MPVPFPYVLLTSVRRINVVSAASLAGEAGPIEHYASPRAINGRAGLYPSRYQSDEVDRQGGLARVANRRLVGGRQVWRGKGVDREAILSKLREFHRDHHSELDQMITDMNAAFAWLPKSTYASEAKPLADLASKKRRGPQPIGDLLVNLLIRLGVATADPVDSKSSEALES